MDNPEVLKIIENLPGRRSYEEKRAFKISFSSLYEYIEDKIKKKSINNECKQEQVTTYGSESASKNKSCGCC